MPPGDRLPLAGDDNPVLTSLSLGPVETDRPRDERTVGASDMHIRDADGSPQGGDHYDDGDGRREKRLLGEKTPESQRDNVE